MAEIEYGYELTPNDPQEETPAQIRVPLKAHQKAALAKAVAMERHGKVRYGFQPDTTYSVYHRRRLPSGRIDVHTNVGVLGDLVGYGKTLTALSLIAANPTSNIYEERCQWFSTGAAPYNTGHLRIVSQPTEAELAARTDDCFATTLIVVPRGPVFTQWRNALLNQTTLRACVIDTMKCVKKFMPPPTATDEEMRAFFAGIDCLLVKSTTLKQLISYYIDRPRPPHCTPIPGFRRIIIDEAHDEVPTIPAMDFKFLWLVTSTYNMLTHRMYQSANYIGHGIRNMLAFDALQLLVVKGTEEFVLASFQLPEVVERTYVCRLSRTLTALQPFLSDAVQERINVNDSAGAIRQMGGAAETEADLIRLVTQNMDRDIFNKNSEIAYYRGLQIDDAQRAAHINRLTAELQTLEERKQAMVDRVSALDGKQCAVCMDTYEDPIMLPCTHVFCGNCIIDWMRIRGASGRAQSLTCPQCRSSIDPSQLIAVVGAGAEADGMETDAAGPAAAAEGAAAPVDEDTDEADASYDQRFKKEEQLVRLIQRKPGGRWLIFATVDNGFHAVHTALTEAGISHAELKGNSNVMRQTLENFRNGSLKAILLHTKYAGSGIDISFATDVVLFHHMGIRKIQAVGRAQRVGRTEPLTVHNILYPHEVPHRE